MIETKRLRTLYLNLAERKNAIYTNSDVLFLIELLIKASIKDDLERD